MAKNYPISLANGTQVIPIAGGAEGTNFITLAFDVPPSAGTVKVESRAVGDDAWSVISGFNNVPATADKTIRFYGSVSQLRVTFAGLSGGSGASIWFATAAGEGFPPMAFEGHRALNVQGYVESNVKLGIQFYVQVALPSISASQTYKMLLRTGSMPVLIKERDFSARGEAVQIQIFKAPTATHQEPDRFRFRRPGTSWQTRRLSRKDLRRVAFLHCCAGRRVLASILQPLVAGGARQARRIPLSSVPFRFLSGRQPNYSINQTG